MSSPAVRPVPALALCLSLLAPVCSAAEPPASLFTENVVVSANLTASDADSVGSSVTVIGPEEIAARDQRTVAELLRGVPGVSVAPAGGPGRTTTVFLRGANSAHTLVLVDGVRVNGPGAGAYDFADLTTDSVERIEILRGPQSSLYGSEAIGGVINITTRRARKGEHVTGRAELGTEGAQHLAAGVEYGDPAFDVRIGASGQRLPGYSRAAEAAGDEEAFPYRNTTVDARAGLALPNHGRVDLTARYLDGTSTLDTFDYRAAPQYGWLHRQALAALKVEVPLGERWRPSLSVGYDRDTTRGVNAENAWDDSEFEQQVAHARLQADVTLAPNDTLTAGAGYEERRGTSTSAFGGIDARVSIASAFLQNQWSWNERLYLTGAVRTDHHSTFGAQTTWRATAAWRIRDLGARVHASYGTGFKAPTLNDLYYPGFGNPNLGPETSQGYDLGWAQSFANGAVTADVTLFRSDFDDLIVFTSAGLPENIARARSRGVEATAAWNTGKALQLEANYTYTDAENLSGEQPLTRRPRHSGSVSAHARFGERCSGFLSLVGANGRYDVDASYATVPVGSYARLDANVRYAFTPAIEAFVRAENLTGRHDVEVLGFRTPGRLVMLGIALK